MNKAPSTKDEYIIGINEVLGRLTDIWIVWQIYRFAINIKKDEKGGVCHE